MSQSISLHQSHSHLAFESKILDAFGERDRRNAHWADDLIHVVPHDHLQKLSYHHQHSQYHLVLFWLENLFPQAALWVGVRDLARLALDFIENSKIINDDPEKSALQFVDSLIPKRAHQTVAQLECLMRCGLARWRLNSVAWRADLNALPRDKGFALLSLLEHQQAAYVESSGDWSITELWKSVSLGKTAESVGSKDVIMFFRRDDQTIDFEQWSPEELKKSLDDYRV